MNFMSFPWALKDYGGVPIMIIHGVLKFEVKADKPSLKLALKVQALMGSNSPLLWIVLEKWVIFEWVGNEALLHQQTIAISHQVADFCSGPFFRFLRNFVDNKLLLLSRKYGGDIKFTRKHFRQLLRDFCHLRQTDYSPFFLNLISISFPWFMMLFLCWNLAIFHWIQH